MDIIRSVNTTEKRVYFNLYEVCTQYMSIVSAWNEVGEGRQHTSEDIATIYDGICMDVYIYIYIDRQIDRYTYI